MSLAKQFLVIGFSLLALIVSVQVPAFAQDADGVWVRPKDASGALIWGRRDGLVFGLPSPGGMRGPRGLIRVGVIGKNGEAELINFIAVEPVVKGFGSRFSRMGFSELEMSELDAGERGKRLWTAAPLGALTTLPAKPKPIERLSVRIEVEPFTANRAHVYVIASVYSDRPRELELTVHHHDDSSPIEELSLTATMGNYERLRYLWLKDRVVDSRELYAGYNGDGFVEKENYPRDEMLSDGDGGALVLATTNEDDPAAIEVTARPWWTYRSVRLTQYWRVPAWHIQPDLRVKANGRRVYWASTTPIPGGLSFENFEARQRYAPGQAFVFGLTPKQPWEFEPGIPRLAARPKFAIDAVPAQNGPLVSAGDFVKVYDPSVGENARWYINDHCFVRGKDGVWHMFGITHAEPAKPLDEKHFAHATASSLTQTPWKKLPFALSADETRQETILWAPHVIFFNKTYYMFYVAGGADHTKYKINLATSSDLKTWKRHPKNPMVVDGFDARDPFILRDKNRWIMYHTANSDPAGGNHIVVYRTSEDLVNWSERKTAFTDPTTGTFGGPTESPFVVRRGDFYYLFIGPRGGYAGTDVFRSKYPFHWTPADKVGHIKSHAAEVTRDVDGRWYVSHSGWGQGGLYLAPLIWNDGLDDAETSLPIPK